MIVHQRRKSSLHTELVLQQRRCAQDTANRDSDALSYLLKHLDGLIEGHASLAKAAVAALLRWRRRVLDRLHAPAKAVVLIAACTVRTNLVPYCLPSRPVRSYMLPLCSSDIPWDVIAMHMRSQALSIDQITCPT